MKTWKTGRRTALLLAAAVLLAIGGPSAAALAHSEGTPYSWYCRRTADHTLPPLDGQLDFIRSHHAFYADEGADESDKVLYLTFDAGYENGNIANILDTLKEKEVPAAFFVLSHLAEKESGLVTRMQEEGHLVCNHTASHRDMSSVTDRETFLAELRALEEAVKEGTGGETAKFYRPPEGRFSERNLTWAEEAGYTTVFWSFAYADWDNDKQPDPMAAKEKILANLHNGSILLLHPTSATNAAILPELIDEAREAGYRFGRIDEIDVSCDR